MAATAKKAFNYTIGSEKKRRLRDLGETLTEVRRVKTRAQVRLRTLQAAVDQGVDIPPRSIEKFRGQIREANKMLHSVATKWAELSLELAK